VVGKNFKDLFETQNIKSADHFGMVLLTAKNLILSKFSQAKGLPEDLKTVFKKDLEEFVAEIRKSLKENLPKTGNDKEK
jgi:TorA maturation chaperone TorD